MFEVAFHEQHTQARPCDFQVATSQAAARSESGCDFARLDLVHVTPDPAFSGFDRTNQRMLGVVKVFGGVLVLGGVATAHVAADQAQTQVDPRVAKFDALLANVRLGGSYFDLIKVSAFLRHPVLHDSGHRITILAHTAHNAISEIGTPSIPR